MALRRDKQKICLEMMVRVHIEGRERNLRGATKYISGFTNIPFLKFSSSVCRFLFFSLFKKMSICYRNSLNIIKVLNKIKRIERDQTVNKKALSLEVSLDKRLKSTEGGSHMNTEKKGFPGGL